MPQYIITHGINPFGDELIWQVRDSDGYLVFVTDLKSEAEAWLDGQENGPTLHNQILAEPTQQ